MQKNIIIKPLNQNNMKGYLQKTESGWFVVYDQRTMQDPSAEDGVLPLYFNNDTELVLDNNQNLNFYSGKEIEFEIINLEDDKYGIGLTYAKLIRQEKNKSDVEKLAEDVYGKGVNYDYEEGFVDGYNKAKETLYTKEQVMDAIRLARQIDYCNADYEIILSLKLK